MQQMVLHSHTRERSRSRGGATHERNRIHHLTGPSTPPDASHRSNVVHRKGRVMSRIDRTATSRARTSWYAIVPLLVFLLAPGAAAQTTTSTIEGTVTDASGAVVPGAEVKVSGTTLAAERTATTGANGLLPRHGPAGGRLHTGHLGAGLCHPHRRPSS